MKRCAIHGRPRGQRAARELYTPERAQEILTEATFRLPPAPPITRSASSKPIRWTPESRPETISTRGVVKSADPKLFGKVEKARRAGSVRPVFAPADPSIWYSPQAVWDWGWDDVDAVVVQYSGGKDSLAALLWVLASGAPKEKVQLWHQNVDGAVGSDNVASFDWPVTHQYLEATGKHFGLPLYLQFIEEGFAGELVRLGKHSAPMWAQDRTPRNRLRWISTGERKAGGLEGRKFGVPAQIPDMRKRWCSAVLKIEPSRWAQRELTREDLKGSDGSVSAGMLAPSRFKRSRRRLKRIEEFYRTLRREGLSEKKARQVAERPQFVVVTGERRSESANRALYHTVQPEPGVATQTRMALRWRPVLHLTDEEVYSLIREAEIQVHPAYELGYGRCSCYGCIFAGAREFATMAQVNPRVFKRLASLEKQLQSMGRPRWTLKGGEKKQPPLAEVVAGVQPYERTFWFQHFTEKAAGRKPFTVADMHRPKGFSWSLPLGYLAGSSGGPPT